MKNRKKRILITLMFVCMMIATGCGKSGSGVLSSSAKLNLTDYITVEFYGSNGDGIASVSYDTTQLELDYSGYDGTDLSSEVLEKMSEIASFEETITYSADPDSGLSNGDTITVTISYDEEEADAIGLKIADTLTKEFTVEDLLGE